MEKEISAQNWSKVIGQIEAIGADVLSDAELATRFRSIALGSYDPSKPEQAGLFLFYKTLRDMGHLLDQSFGTDL